MAPSSSSSAYAFKPGGSLNFKGGDSPNATKKKKKKSRSSTSQEVRKGESSSSAIASYQNDEDRDLVDDLKNPSKEEDEDDNEEKTIGPTMTEAEKKFDMIRKKRLAERVAKQAKLSHKDRVDAFNRDLESRTEHFEMGRVGGGG